MKKALVLLDPMKKSSVLTAFAAVFGIPLMMLGQQLLLPSVKPPKAPPLHSMLMYDWDLMAATDRIMDSRQPNAVYFVSVRWLQRNDPVSAECWMHHGAAECRYPSIMLLYGDFCRQQKRFSEARRWFRLAETYGKKANAEAFCKIIEQRLRALPPEEKR